MSGSPGVPAGAAPHPDHDGWFYWPEIPTDSFAGQTGLMLFRAEGAGARVRWFPTDTHVNMGGSIFGGAVLSFIDMALFAGGRCAGMDEGHYVTLDCSVQFIGRGRIGVPLDAEVRLVKQTAGGHVFFIGTCDQDGEPTHSFSGTLKRVKPRG